MCSSDLAMARLAGAVEVGAATAGFLLLSGLENSPHRGAYGEEEERDIYYTLQAVCMLVPSCHKDPNDPNAPRLVKQEREAMRQEALLQQAMEALNRSRPGPGFVPGPDLSPTAMGAGHE